MRRRRRIFPPIVLSKSDHRENEGRVSKATPFRLGYRPALDGMRAIAILLVMGTQGTHLRIPYMVGGFYGVDIFFVLSGFLITSLLLQEWRSSGAISLARFYGRRMVRLFPALFVMLLGTGLVAAFFAVVGRPVLTAGDVLLCLFYVGNWANAFGLTDLGPIGHTWSLAIEEQFYLLWPIGLLALLRWRGLTWTIVWIPLAAAILSYLDRNILQAGGASIARLYYASDTHAEGILLGCATALAVARYWPLGHRVGHLAGAVVITSLPLAAFAVAFDPRPEKIANLAGFTIINVVTAATIVRVVTGPSSLITRGLSWAPLVFVGKLSYALYLWHVPICSFLDMLPLGWPFGVGVAVRVVLSAAFALASYYLIERRFSRLKTHFEARVPATVPA